MSFELLPNEIFLDLFDYFDGIDLLHAFYGLNLRFNCLLYKQYRAFRFKFNSISKCQFDIICQQHLPFVADRIITLGLSNGDDTPQKMDLFFSYIPSMNQFTHLRSLSLSNLHIYAIIMKIIDQCHQICHFTHFKLDSHYLLIDQIHYQSIIDNIWSLPKLIHCEINIIIAKRLDFYTPTKISSSLKSLSFFWFPIKLNQLNHLFKYTPRLKNLSIAIQDSTDDYSPSLLPTLINLDIRIPRMFDISKIVCFFQNIPNLRHLNINLLSNIIDGYQWKQIINNYLPKLKTFQFKMQDTLDFDFDQNIPERMNELIDSFRTSFWTDERRWFVRCFVCEKTIYLCTLSATLPSYQDTFPELFISTYPNDDLQNLCNDMTEIFNYTFFYYPISSYLRLTNLKDLKIKFPINNQFWSIVPNLNQLKSVTAFVNANTSQFELQTLLDRAPHLNQLTIYQNDILPLQIDLLKCTNTSVRQLDLEQCDPYFNEEECMELAHSSLGAQCQTLSIAVNNRECILNLLYNMNNLRALNVRWEGEMYSERLLTETDNENVSHKDEIVQWLKERLLSRYLIATDSEFTNRILIWI